MTDAEIIKLFLNRDGSALAEAEKQYRDYCLYIARNVLQDERDAEECLNDALYAAWKSIPSQRPENLKTYLGKLVREFAVDRWRSNNAQKRRPGSLSSLEELEGVIADCGGYMNVGEIELGQLIHDFLLTEGATERNVFIRRYWYYDPIDAIAERYGIGRSKVKMILKRVRERLSAYLKREGYNEY